MGSKFALRSCALLVAGSLAAQLLGTAVLAADKVVPPGLFNAAAANGATAANPEARRSRAVGADVELLAKDQIMLNLTHFGAGIKRLDSKESIYFLPIFA